MGDKFQEFEINIIDFNLISEKISNLCVLNIELIVVTDYGSGNAIVKLSCFILKHLKQRKLFSILRSGLKVQVLIFIIKYCPLVKLSFYFFDNCDWSVVLFCALRAKISLVIARAS